MDKLEKILKYKFNNKDLLIEALTHPSMSSHQKEKFNYERLEFLGDSILSCIIIEYLFLKHPKETEGELSKRKAYLVSKNTLYSIARKLNLGEFIIMTKGEENCGGRENINNLENIVESIIAAIYLDSNFMIVKDFILSLWKEIDEKAERPPEYPKTALQIWCLKNTKKLPNYTIIDNSTRNTPSFLVKLKIDNLGEVEAIGSSIKEAKNKSAVKMLKIIESVES